MNIVFYDGKKVLVTGGAGQIGSALVKELLGQGAKVTVLDNLSSGSNLISNLPRHRNMEFLLGSVTEDMMLAKAFGKRPEIVFHLAALFANQNSVDHPRDDLLVNGMGTLKVLQFAQKYGAKRVVFSSSSCVYGNKTIALSEKNNDFDLETPYAITKLLGEKYCTYFHERCGLETVILRYFNTYGPGEYPGKYRCVIPNFICLAIKGKPLPITGSGRETRDFSFNLDTVRGTMLAGEKKKAAGEVFNIGSGKETSILELARKINGLAGNKAGMEFVPRREWDSIQKRVASISKAGKILGYRPKHSLDEGLKRTYEWLMEAKTA